MENEKLKLIRLADVETQEVSWLWYPYIPAGKITILEGDPGEGKTMLSLFLAAAVTNGALLPLQTTPPLPPASVIFQSAEDGLADTIKPRLERAGADLSRIITIDEGEQPLSVTDSRIEEAILRERAKLLILDPLQAFLGADVDMHRANEVRPAMRKLANTADNTGCAVVLIGHLNKMQSAKGIQRGLGSIDIAAVARSILSISSAQDSAEKRYLAHLKSSLAPAGKTLIFRIEDSLVFDGESPLSADQIMSGYISLECRETKRDNAMAAIEECLAKGARPAMEVYEHCLSLGLSKRTVDSAKQALCVRSIKRDDRWYWAL